MSDATLSILLTALPPTLVALTGVIVGIINSIKANKIHILVNSKMTNVQNELAAVKEELVIAKLSVADLQAVIAKATLRA